MTDKNVNILLLIRFLSYKFMFLSVNCLLFNYGQSEQWIDFTCRYEINIGSYAFCFCVVVSHLYYIETDDLRRPSTSNIISGRNLDLVSTLRIKSGKFSIFNCNWANLSKTAVNRGHLQKKSVFNFIDFVLFLLFYRKK